MIKNVCVFCGSARGSDPAYADAARQIGATLARSGIGVVYGGGHVGLMGIVADAALAEGGRAIGIIPEPLARKEIAHEGLTELIVVPDMHTRKAMMAERSDAFLTLPGGVGTLEELFEILTWAVLRLHRKPIGILNVAGYYDPLLELLDHIVGRSFLPKHYLSALTVGTDPEELIGRLLQHRPLDLGPKWIELEQT